MRCHACDGLTNTRTWESRAASCLSRIRNKSVELKTSSFEFETGPGGEDEECLDDGSGEEPEGESESERFEQILESVVKVKVKRKVKVKLKFGQQLISPYFPAPRPLHLKADLHQEGIFFSNNTLILTLIPNH